MFFIPFPFVIAELVIFVMAVRHWGFLNTLGLYLLPCLLGLFIVTTIGRVAVLSMQTSMMKGQLPGSKLLHTAAVFLSGLLFLIPSFFTRVLGVVLFLPGLRHFAVWRFKGYLAKQMSRGAGSFTFGAGGPFGFRAGSAGFRYYGEAAQEREVHEANVLDVTPLKVVHENKKKDDGEEPQ